MLSRTSLAPYRDVGDDSGGQISLAPQRQMKKHQHPQSNNYPIATLKTTLSFPMSLRTRILAVVGAFGALYLAFYLGTRWGPPLLDVGYALPATFKQTWGITQESMEETYGDVIGIELGNDYSRVGIFKDDRFILIASDEGQTKIPNYVTLTYQGVITGLKAKEQADSNAENTIYDFRRLLGREFPDTSLQQEIGLLPYKVVEKDSRPFLQIQINGTEKLYSPEEITAEILKRLKTAAEHWTSNRITNAVINVPAYFNDAQRQATRDASAIAGLNVLRLIDEPRAAGLAYELDKFQGFKRNDKAREEPIKEDLHGNVQFEAPAINCLGIYDEYSYLVFNIEERSCDLTITNADHGVFEQLGNLTSDFGTRDFDHDLFRYLLNPAHAGVAQIDISEDFEGIDRLNLEVKQAQETLLTFPSANINVSSHNGEKILSTVVTREEVQELQAEGSVYKIIGLVEKVLSDAKLGKRAIDGLIVTGDPVYAAKIQTLLQGYFEDAQLHSDVKSDEVVVLGVARMAGIFSGEYKNGWDIQYPIDLLPLSVGIETAGGLYTKVISRNTFISTIKTKVFLPGGDSQEKVVLRIYEGEREFVKYNRYLGTLELDGLSRRQREEVEIEVAFVLAPEFELTVTAKEKGFDHEAEVVFDCRTLRHETWQEVDDILMEAEKTYEADLQEKEKAIAENSWKLDNFGVFDVI